MPDDEAALTADIIAFATEYGRYGYRRIAAMLRDAGWVVNDKRIERAKMSHWVWTCKDPNAKDPKKKEDEGLESRSEEHTSELQSP